MREQWDRELASEQGNWSHVSVYELLSRSTWRDEVVGGQRDVLT